MIVVGEMKKDQVKRNHLMMIISAISFATENLNVEDDFDGQRRNNMSIEYNQSRRLRRHYENV